jgi:hypothetical protein
MGRRRIKQSLVRKNPDSRNGTATPCLIPRTPGVPTGTGTPEVSTKTPCPKDTSPPGHAVPPIPRTPAHWDRDTGPLGSGHRASTWETNVSRSRRDPH